jgi:hypothetical protein
MIVQGVTTKSNYQSKPLLISHTHIRDNIYHLHSELETKCHSHTHQQVKFILNLCMCAYEGNALLIAINAFFLQYNDLTELKPVSEATQSIFLY